MYEIHAFVAVRVTANKSGANRDCLTRPFLSILAIKSRGSELDCLSGPGITIIRMMPTHGRTDFTDGGKYVSRESMSAYREAIMAPSISQFPLLRNTSSAAEVS
jgi:hypothetical protein